MDRSGRVFADRYHAHILRTRAEVANAIAYVVGNYAVHALRRGQQVAAGFVDEYSSAYPRHTGAPLVAVPQGWLLRIGWQDAGGQGKHAFAAQARPAKVA